MVTLETAFGVIDLGAPIAKGKLGAVYTGVHRKTNRRVAVKLLEAGVDDEAVVRFFADVRSVNATKHAHVAEVLGTGRAVDRRTYVVSEQPEGRPLHTLLAQQYRVSVQTALQWSIQVLGALEAAHAVGVVHRGIKPSNLYVVEPPRRTPFIKVLDFGASRLAALPRHTSYLAPEQLEGTGVSFATDLYALGCVMYELISGRPPFTSTDQARKTLPVLSQVLPGIPRPLEQYVEWLMQRTPTSRPQSTEMALEHALALQEIFPRRRSMPTPLPANPNDVATCMMSVAAQPSLAATIMQRVPVSKPQLPADPFDVPLDPMASEGGYDATFLRPSSNEAVTLPGLMRAEVPPTKEAPASMRRDDAAKPTLIAHHARDAKATALQRALVREPVLQSVEELFSETRRPDAAELEEELFSDLDPHEEPTANEEPQAEPSVIVTPDEGTLPVEREPATKRKSGKKGLIAIAALFVLSMVGGATGWHVAPDEVKEQATAKVETLLVQLKGSIGLS
ncbi:MAG: serine/threonine protein kinase [Myxococcaceae bacterium]|nr:serine/threonine protein kinase [Myxococcaceae bacterium]